MRAALLTMVHDYLGYGYLAGQVVHGFSGCVRCMDDTTHRQLDRDPGSSKTVFMGHRRWLRDDGVTVRVAAKCMLTLRVDSSTLKEQT